jgi:hypothetical protein
MNLILKYVLVYFILFINFGALYIVFEGLFNRISMDGIIEAKLKKSKRCYFIYSSIWMFLVGGLSAIFINLLYQIPLIHDLNIFIICIWGSIVITGLELLAGIILKKLNAIGWDYSSSKIKIFGKIITLNFKGYIDVWHSLGWYFITIPLCLYSDLIFKLLK